MNIKRVFLLVVAAIMLSANATAVVNFKKTKGRYTDMYENYWGYENIEECTSRGWLKAFDGEEFLPETAVTYEEAVKTVSLYADREIKTELSEKYADGDNAITRADALYLLMSALDYVKEKDTANPFLIINAYTDYESISEAMQPIFSIATSKGIISGYGDKTAKPDEPLTRAELASMLCNAEKAKAKNALRDNFTKRFGISETNAIGDGDTLLLQSTGDYFILDVNALSDGYYTFEADYSHDSYEIVTKIVTTYPDGSSVEFTRGLLSGKHTLSVPVYLKKGKNRVRFQHNLRQVPVYILPLYIYDVECKDKEENLKYELSPDNALLLRDNPKTLLTNIKNYKDELVKVETEDGINIPFKDEAVGENAYTEAMLRVYLDDAAIGKLPQGKYTLNYHLKSGVVLNQSLEISDKTPGYKLEYINFGVGKANSTLIKLPNGKNLLIDSGYDSTAEQKIIPYLKKHNIKLDYYLLTHFHKDHYGMKDEILAMNGIQKPDEEKADAMIKASKKERAEYLKNFGYLDSKMLCAYDNLHEIWDLGGVEIEALNSRFYENGEPAVVYKKPFYRINEYNYENATSVSFMLVYNGFRYYHGADTYSFCVERYMQDMIKANRADELSCHWYFGNHHFQYDISPDFIKTMNPVVVYIPNGDTLYPRTTYTQHYKEDVENSPYHEKRLVETLVSHEVGSACVRVNSGDDWCYEMISDEDMYN